MTCTAYSQIDPSKQAKSFVIFHSCNPTSKIDDSWVVAVADIPSGTEVTFDYSQNEDMLASPFICRCCGRFITGSK